jgi:hypothetical protein
MSQSRNDMEIDVDLKAIFSIPFTSSWFTLPVLGIDEIELLVLLSVLFVHKKLSVL